MLVELAGRGWHENEVKKRRRKEGRGRERREGKGAKERGKPNGMTQKLGENERKRVGTQRNGAHEKR